MSYSDDERYDLHMAPGCTFDDGGIWYDENKAAVDLAGYTGECIFKHPTTGATVLTATTANSKILFSGAVGEFAFNLSPADVASIPHGANYALRATKTSTSKVTQLLYGKAFKDSV